MKRVLEFVNLPFPVLEPIPPTQFQYMSYVLKKNNRVRHGHLGGPALEKTKGRVYQMVQYREQQKSITNVGSPQGGGAAIHVWYIYIYICLRTEVANMGP